MVAAAGPVAAAPVEAQGAVPEEAQAAAVPEEAQAAVRAAVRAAAAAVAAGPRTRRSRSR